MLGNLLFLIGLIVCLGIGFIYFRDLGDFSQMVMKIKRKNMLRSMANGSGKIIHDTE
jgi:hypothetical protein